MALSERTSKEVCPIGEVVDLLEPVEGKIFILADYISEPKLRSSKGAHLLTSSLMFWEKIQGESFCQLFYLFFGVTPKYLGHTEADRLRIRTFFARLPSRLSL